MSILNMIYGSSSSTPVPLNSISDLSVTGGDQSATIKWTDPGNLTVNGVLLTNWSSTKLVRKVGSAPSTSSDGTLVVNETTADTYSSTGYEDTGLTNGTTYYYKAFAVGNNGTESASNAVNVTPQAGWQPGVNTMCYFPLDVDFSDSVSGNSLTGYNSAAIGTLNGVSCLDCTPSSSYISGIVSALPQGNQARTNMFWVYYAVSEKATYSYGSTGNGNGDSVWVFNNDGINWSQYGGSIGTGTGSAVTGQRYHVAITIDGSTEQKIYLNGVQAGPTGSLTVNTSGTTLNLGRNQWDNRYLSGYLSKFIVENRVWTAGEISAYFDATKGDYGIS